MFSDGLISTCIGAVDDREGKKNRPAHARMLAESEERMRTHACIWYIVHAHTCMTALSFELARAISICDGAGGSSDAESACKMYIYIYIHDVPELLTHVCGLVVK